MVNPFWVAPMVVLAIGSGVILYVARDAARAARELGEGLSKFAEVRAALDGLVEHGGALRKGLEQYRRK